jgi:hypothetical protein
MIRLISHEDSNKSDVSEAESFLAKSTLLRWKRNDLAGRKSVVSRKIGIGQCQQHVPG